MNDDILLYEALGPVAPPQAQAGAPRVRMQVTC